MSEMISILSIEEKKSKVKQIPFLAVETDQGKMSAWDGIIIDHIKASIGKVCELDVERAGKFANITKFIKVTEQKPSQAPQVQDQRLMIDTGNTLMQAVELVKAVIANQDAKSKFAIPAMLHEAAEACAEEFLNIKSRLLQGEAQADPKKDPSKGETPAGSQK